MPIQYTNGSDTLTQQVDKLSLHTNGYNQSPLYAKGTSQINGSNLPNTQWAQVASSSGKGMDIERKCTKKFFWRILGIDLKQISIPRPAPDEILVKIEFSGVCHTDLHAWKGRESLLFFVISIFTDTLQVTGLWHPKTLALVSYNSRSFFVFKHFYNFLSGGHEGAGYVAAIGSEVNDLHIGDVVGIQVRQCFGFSWYITGQSDSDFGLITVD